MVAQNHVGAPGPMQVYYIVRPSEAVDRITRTEDLIYVAHPTKSSFQSLSIAMYVSDDPYLHSVVSAC